MPPFVKFVQYGIAVVLLVFASLAVWGVAARGDPVGGIGFALLCMLAVIGLLRQVAWGRFLVSCISVLSAFSIAARLLPIPDDVYEGGGALEQWLGYLPPAWLSWLLVVSSCALVLLPAVIIGWRKEWFRSTSW